MRQKLGWVITAVSLAVNAVGALSPERITDLRLGFVLFMIKHLRLELVAFLLLGILLVLPLSVWKRVWNRIGQIISKNIFAAVVFITVALIWLIPVGKQYFLVARARMYFYQNLLYPTYRQELLDGGSELEAKYHFNEAVSHYRAVITAFPHDFDNWWLRDKIKRIENLVNYSELHAKRALAQARLQGINRRSFFLLVEALRLNPTSVYLQNEVQGRIERIEAVRDVPMAFYLACRNGDQVAASTIFDDNAWYLFEDEVSNDMLRGPFGKPKKFSVQSGWELLHRLSADEFRKMVETSWQLLWARQVLEKSRNVGLIEQ